MKSLLRFILPLLVLAVGVSIAVLLIKTAPQAERKRPQIPPPTVEVRTLERQDYQVRVESRGTVTPLTVSTLIPEVSGRIVAVADSFRSGGFFNASDLLLQIDPRDYQNAVTVARAELVQRRQALAEEQARSRQASDDWRKLQLAGEPDPLVLREPQLETVRAQLAAAEARLRQAELELERTRILAPYAGRVLEKKVDYGQYVSVGTSLGEIYASDSVEVRLPITSEQQVFLDLPATDPQSAGQSNKQPLVEFSARTGEREDVWPGRLVRTEARVDVRSRQLFVVAQIDDPYRRHEGRAPLKIGQFLEAKIYGKLLEDVFVIPREAVRGENTVHLIDDENRLRRQPLEVLWKDQQHLIARGLLQAGDRLSLTALPFAADGIKVRVAGEQEQARLEKPAAESTR